MNRDVIENDLRLVKEYWLQTFQHHTADRRLHGIELTGEVLRHVNKEGTPFEALCLFGLL